MRVSVLPATSARLSQVRCGFSTPASMRDMSSRLPTSRLRWSSSSSTTSNSSSRAGAAQSTSPLRRLVMAAFIVASGVRSSCETDESRADLSRSLSSRMRAWVSACDSRACSSARAPWPANVASSRSSAGSSLTPERQHRQRRRIRVSHPLRQ